MLFAYRQIETLMMSIRLSVRMLFLFNHQADPTQIWDGSLPQCLLQFYPCLKISA